MRRFFPLLLLLASSIAAPLAWAQGGPPFITDDPGTPGNKHWEINFGWEADHNPGNAYYETPDVDMNYGWGDRIQLKYELPLAASTDQNNTTRAGLGESLLGIKWRPYEHHRAGQPKSDENMDFSLGTYPQASINNPTSAVRRGIVENGPQYYLPIEATARLGPLGLNGEVGHWFGNQLTPSRWARGLIAGHEFSDRFELYGEIYDLQDANRLPLGRGVGNFAASGVKARETTLALGGRQALNKAKTLNLLLMGGRSFQKASGENGQPSWIAYVGLQMLLGPKEPETPPLELKVPSAPK